MNEVGLCVCVSFTGEHPALFLFLLLPSSPSLTQANSQRHAFQPRTHTHTQLSVDETCPVSHHVSPAETKKNKKCKNRYGPGHRFIHKVEKPRWMNLSKYRFLSIRFFTSCSGGLRRRDIRLKMARPERRRKRITSCYQSFFHLPPQIPWHVPNTDQWEHSALFHRKHGKAKVECVVGAAIQNSIIASIMCNTSDTIFCLRSCPWKWTPSWHNTLPGSHIEVLWFWSLVTVKSWCSA